jgi:hypothetical protein
VWGERYDSEILPGRAARGGGGGGLGGGGKVGENEDTGGYSLHLVLGQPPLGRDDDNDEFFGPKRFQTRIPARLTAPDHGQKGVTYSFNHVAIDGYKENSAQHATRGFETVFFYK